MNHLKLLLPLTVLLIILATSCKKDCDLKSKYIYEPIVFDETCNCIVSGKVKYLKDCQTVALVDYGDGTCDNVATKTICVDGKCESNAGAQTETFQFDCQKEVVDGPIDDNEAAQIGI